MDPSKVLESRIEECFEQPRSLTGGSHGAGAGQVSGPHGGLLCGPVDRVGGFRAAEGHAGIAEELVKGRG